MMVGEFQFLGMYFPWLMMTALLALLVSQSIRTLMARKGLYRHIWHPPLFDLALFVIVLSLFITIVNAIRS